MKPKILNLRKPKNSFPVIFYIGRMIVSLPRESEIMSSPSPGHLLILPIPRFCSDYFGFWHQPQLMFLPPASL